jgi:hypothetical protein
LAARPLATIADDGAQTVASWSTEYLRYVELSQGLRFTTVAYYRSKLELHALPALGIIRLSALTGDDINRMMRGFAEEKMSPRMRAMCFGALRAVLLHAVR